jgi:glycosyltransferase involved in cell wall biosynthesis
MDGGSTDRTLEILEQYKDAISICVSEKDKGQSDALIKGFNLATGDFLNWINSDDILSKMGLFHIAGASLKNPEANFIHGRNGIMTIDSELYSYMPHPEDNLEQRYISEMPYGQQACFFSRQLYINCGGINRELRFSMDYELYLRIHDNTKTAQLENIMRLENGNAFMTFLESAGDLRKAGFLKSTGHLPYGTYKINIPLGKKFIRQTFLAYLKKNIWYYYNVKQIKVAARMALQIMKLEPSSLTNKNYLKIIIDGIRQRQFN